MSRNVYALTKPTPAAGYPEYVSVNTSGIAGHKVSITVRSPPKADNTCGDTATIELALDEAAELARCIMDHVFYTAD